MERSFSPRLRETIYRGELPGGLRVQVIPKPGYQKKYATFSVKYGSIDNCFFPSEEKSSVRVPDGIAHFLEHKLFEEEDGDVFERFAALGASANAFTSHTNTTYLFSATENFQDALKLLLDFVQRPIFTAENVLKEQGIIEQELRMYLDDPRWRVFQNLLEAMYQTNPVRIDIAGTVESIREITPAHLYLCYRTFYQPSNMLVSVVGDVEPEEIMTVCRDNLLHREKVVCQPPRRVYPDEPKSIGRKLISQKMAVSQPIFRVGFKETGTTGGGGEELLRREIVSSILLEILFGRSSSLYEELYNEGLVDDTFSASFQGEAEFGLSLVGGRTKDPEGLVNRLQGGLEKAKQEGLREDAWQRLQKKSLGEFLTVFNSPEAISHLVNAYTFQDVDPFAFPEVLESIELGELETRLREHLTEDRMVVSTVMPL